METLRSVAAVSIALLATGCIESGTITCQVSRACGASTVQTCCTTGHCEYRIGQQVIPCNGTDCTLAAPRVDAICPARCDGGGSVDSGVGGC